MPLRVSIYIIIHTYRCVCVCMYLYGFMYYVHMQRSARACSHAFLRVVHTVHWQHGNLAKAVHVRNKFTLHVSVASPRLLLRAMRKVVPCMASTTDPRATMIGRQLAQRHSWSVQGVGGVVLVILPRR